ncbi:nucleotide-diphospho-sugar transferase [Nitzschia inconspicua]|uniref:Nucleotide-diphospho-sugar transferase n=1 Tax=Nitzschia inconspicua TaxID=303405 RepID=A0A9K3P948_9STRA|nr:PLC-like phosphodiesterase, TIM beta/alpha-barrel-containing protein domain containing protein [Nitzschia inconspicua]KAG7373642.1 nucleotide-diphospho-sugar transferase [Nitzschia inconspicua]
MDSSAIRLTVDAHVPTSNDPVTTTASIASKLMKFEQEICSKQEEVRCKQEEVDHAEQVIETKIQEKQQQIRSKQEEIQSKEEEIHPKQQHLDHAKQVIEEQIQEKQHQLHSKQQEIHSKKQLMDHAKKQVSEESNLSSSKQLLHLQREQSSLHDELKSLQDELKSLYDRLLSLEREVHSLKQELYSLKHELYSLKQEVHSLEQEVHSLKQEVHSLEQEVHFLQQDQFALEQSFREGRYFAALLDHWKSSPMDIEGNNQKVKDIQFTDFRRTPEEADSIRIRRYDTRQGNFTTDHPYKATRRGAQIQDTFAVASDTVGATTSRQHSSENASTIRNKMVWPTDIFGNGFFLSDEDIGNILPAGQAHNEWMHIAASVVGLGNNNNNNNDDDDEQAAGVWKKALRGYQKGTPKNSRTVAGSGLVNFVSNKLRISCHQHLFDGQFPKAILIPTMSLESAKTWKGEAYSAIFAAGFRGMVETDCHNQDDDDASINYRAARLNWTEEEVYECIRDASAVEIESARITLTHAVLAVRDFMRNSNAASRINDFDIPKTCQDHLYQSHKHANETTYPLPQKVEATENQKPLCLVRFGSFDDKDKHPAPDPLLLAYKAAAIWGMVTDKRLLSNGADPYTYSFYDDQGFYEGPKTWEELAMGLGQPHGYQES